MGVGKDAVEEFGCSDQRLIFRLVLAEVRKLRKAMHDASCELAGAKEGCRVAAIKILDEGRGSQTTYTWNDAPNGNGVVTGGSQ